MENSGEKNTDSQVKSNFRENIVRDYEPGDEIEINKLFNEVFNTQRELCVWEWKFKGSYLPAPDWINIVLNSKNELVAHYGSSRHIFKYNGRDIRCAQPVDNIVRKDFRGGNTQKAAFQSQVERAPGVGVEFGFGFPNREAYVVGRRLLKYKDLAKINILREKVTLARFSSFHLKTAKLIPLVRFLSKIFLYPLRKYKIRNISSGLKVEHPQEFGDEFRVFCEKAHNFFPIMEKRCIEFLRWRFIEHPVNKYKIVCLKKEDEIIGYSVIRFIEEDYRLAYIMDFLAVPEKDVIRRLIGEIELLCFEHGADDMIFWVNESCVYHREFLDYGFKCFGEPVSSIYHLFPIHTVDPEFFSNPANWYLNLASTDSF